MAGQDTNLRVKISGDIQDIKRNLGLVVGEFAKVKQAAAASAPNMANWSKGIGAFRQQLAGLAGAYVGFQTIGAAVRGVFDAFDRMDRVEELTHIVRLSANEWSKWIYTAQFAGVETEKLKTAFFAFESTLGKNDSLLKKMGATAPTTQGKLLQLADAFAKIEDSQVKAEVARKLFGKGAADLLPILSQGSAALLAMGAEAERTGNAFDQAGVEAAAQFNDNLDALKGTMQGVFNVTAQQLAPAMGAYAAAANEGAKESNLAGDAGTVLANVFKGVAFAAVLVKNAIEAVSNVIGAMVEISAAAGRAMSANFGSILTTISNSFQALLTGGPLSAAATFGAGIAGSVKVAQQGMEQFRASAAHARSIARDGIRSAISDVSDAFAMFDKRATDAAGKSQTSARKRAAEIKAALEKAALEAALAGELGGASDKDGSAKAKEKVKDAIAGLVDHSALAMDQVERDLDALEQRYEDGRATLAEYFKQRQALELERIDLKLVEAQADAMAAKSSDEQSRALTEIIKLQRDRAAIGPKTARDQANAEREAAAATLQNLSAKYGQITGGLSATEGSLSAQMDAGTLGMTEGERQLQAARQKTLEQLRVLREQQSAYLASLGPDSPEYAQALQGLAGIDTSMANVSASMQTFKQGIEDQAVGALSGFFDDLIDSAKSFKEAFVDMVRSFLSGVAKMIAQQVALQAVKAAMSAFGGGSANGDIFSSAGKSAFAKGGAFDMSGLQAFANGGAFTNQLFSVPTMFAFGKGGQFGVMGEAGPEAVMPLTRGPGGRLGVDAHGAGAGGGKRVRVVVVDDERKARDYMTPGHEEAVLVHIGNNAGRIKEILS